VPIHDPQILGALERLQLRTRRPLAGTIAGGHRSRRYGTSLDFADFRQYQPGDDFRRIDYGSLARLDQLLIRLYEAEDDLVVRLVIDTSASMGLDGKLRRAAEVAAAIGFVALTRRDAVTVHTAPDGAGTRSRPRRFSGRNHWPLLRDHLDGLEAGGAGSLVTTAADLLLQSGPAGITVLVSDLLDPEWESALRRLPARGADLAVVQVLGAGELDPPAAGDVDLVDVETGRRLPLSLTDEAIERYELRRDAWLERVANRVAALGAAHTLIRADDDLRQVVLGSLRADEVLAT
jgi:uncharacterized protein (DUF58 family)